MQNKVTLSQHNVKHLDSIESLRGVAALMVVIYHLVELVKLPIPSSLGFIPENFGLGVPLFYALSGFVLTYGYAKELSGRGEILQFYIRRLFRIAPLFYVMLLVWLLADFLVWHHVPSLLEILFNLGFMFGLVPGWHESIVWAGWSIGIEMIFYFIFPLVMVLVSNIWLALFGFVISCLISNEVFHAFTTAGLGSYAYMNIGTHLPFFFAGVSAFEIWKVLKFRWRPFFGLGFLLVSIALSFLIVDSSEFRLVLAKIGLDRAIWAIIFSMVIVSVCSVDIPIFSRGPLRNLGRVSFSFYLLHPLILVVLIKLGFPGFVSSLSASVLGNFIFAAVVVVFIVWIFSTVTYRFIERPGIELGRFLARRVNC